MTDGEKDMKKNFLISALALFIFTGCAMANGMVFDPTQYSSTSQIPVSKTNTNSLTNSAAKLPANTTISGNIQSQQNLAQDAISDQAGNFNNALFELDAAQVNIRNELLDYKAKYQEVDTQYQLIKEQRRVLSNQIKTIERRIKDIERSKSQIRKTMI